jgi:hypothetical protein
MAVEIYILVIKAKMISVIVSAFKVRGREKRRIEIQELNLEICNLSDRMMN